MCSRLMRETDCGMQGLGSRTNASCTARQALQCASPGAVMRQAMSLPMFGARQARSTSLPCPALRIRSSPVCSNCLRPGRDQSRKTGCWAMSRDPQGAHGARHLLSPSRPGGLLGRPASGPHQTSTPIGRRPHHGEGLHPSASPRRSRDCAAETPMPGPGHRGPARKDRQPWRSKARVRAGNQRRSSWRQAVAENLARCHALLTRWSPSDRRPWLSTSPVVTCASLRCRLYHPVTMPSRWASAT